MIENNFKIITWDQLKIGDIFPDGSVVTDIKPWSYKKCYCLETDNGSIIAADTHLFKCTIEIEDTNSVENNDTNKELDKLYDQLTLSLASRIEAGVTDNETETENESSNFHSCWLCSEDIFDIFTKKYDDKNHKYKVLMLENDGNNNYYIKVPLKSISLFKKGEVQKVRCITTTTGFYNVNGFINHNCGSSQVAGQLNVSNTIMATLDGWGTSPIIQKMREAKTTEEARDILYNGLKEQYHNAGIAQDEFNLQMIAKKLTSYKRDSGGLRVVNPGEKCDVVSMLTVGNYGNIFKTSELSTGYKHLTKPLEQKLKVDAANQILK